MFNYIEIITYWLLIYTEYSFKLYRLKKPVLEFKQIK